MRFRVSAIFLTMTILFSVSSAFSDEKSAAPGTFTGQISDSICAVEGSHRESMSMSKDMHVMKGIFKLPLLALIQSATGRSRPSEASVRIC